MTDEEKRDWLRSIVSWGLQSARQPYIDSPRPYYPEQIEGVVDSLIEHGITPELFVKIKELEAANDKLAKKARQLDAENAIAKEYNIDLERQ